MQETENLHDDNGPDLQQHWVNGELVITLSDQLATELDWHEGDTVVFTVDELTNSISIKKKQP